MKQTAKPKALSDEEKSFLALRETLAYVARELSQLPNAPALAAKGVDEAFQALNTVLFAARSPIDDDSGQRLH